MVIYMGIIFFPLFYKRLFRVVRRVLSFVTSPRRYGGVVGGGGRVRWPSSICRPPGNMLAFINHCLG